MRIRTRSTRRRTDRITLNLASMIDVTFLLLIYFMVTMVLTITEDRLSPTLQTERESHAGPSSDFQPQIIEVLVLEGAPSYRMGTRVFRSRGDLKTALSELPTTQGVFVQVFDHVPVEFAVAAIQVARDVGFLQVTYVPAK